MIIILFGPPGCGKGTQAQFLLESGKFVHLSTGDLLRSEINRGTPIGIEVKNIIEKGDFPSDTIILKLVESFLLNIDDKHVILDGFPRTKNQAYMLDELLKLRNETITFFFDFKIDIANLIERISGRFSCAKCGAVYHDKSRKPKVEGVCDICGSNEFVRRADDQPDVLRNRVDKFLNTTAVVKDYYEQKGVVIPLDASSGADNLKTVIKDVLVKAGFYK